MRVVMMGTGTFAEPTLDALLTRPGLVVGAVTQPDREVGAKRGTTRQVGRGVKEIAQSAGIPVIQPESINAPNGVAALRDLKPDLLVVAAYGQILSPEVLSVPPMGGINVHASLLPKYRGAAPVAWAIWKGEIRTGVTIIRMSAGLDAGEMLAQESLEIGPEETAGELEARLAPLGARLALEIVDRMALGPVVGTKQDLTGVTKAPKLKKEMGLIDWSRPADEICRHIRAMQPFPTAYTFYHHSDQQPMRLIVTRATICSIDDASERLYGAAIPILGRMIVQSGNGGCVEILELQPSGKRRMAAVEFLRGHPIRGGDRFGPESF
jgi:methionyl-tRNA formyltransferase